MAKAKKSLRSFRCSGAFWAAIDKAADDQGISRNEWINMACARNLKDPIFGEPTDLKEVAELGTVDAVRSIAEQIQRTNLIFEKTAKELGVNYGD
jgi:hypothetical protein